MSENIQMICSINNRTNQELKPQSKHLSWGKFTSEPTAIPAKKTLEAFRSSGRQGSASGTEGTVVYQMGEDPKALITIFWDVPWKNGGNNVIKTGTFNEDVSASISGYDGRGAVEAVTITVVDGR
jgi:hypothetical protein